ncbi:hypothetical protein BDV95DRAFT_221543 [Massariosphaeria phaeospora]|uniref:Rhodopsin domain-containing protein n=1 Tax=Massariosphaeria phaeospora TaxID=100035 RepID=A0A7C8ICL6_9PLEO|nr:hypothetical protein BDV95DRAFT_221543 [Massariosphaeria phaeospora]
MAVGDSGLQPANLFLTLFPFILSTLIVSTRIWRRVVERKFGLDDLLIAIAQVLLGALTIATWIFIKVSYTGYHLESVPKGAMNKMQTAKWRYVNAVLYNPILALIKISFVLTLIKLGSTNRWIRHSLWGLLAINCMFMVAGTLIAMLNCVPIPKFWDRTIPGTCIDVKKYIYSTVIVTIITDVLVTAMPAWILYGLQMRRTAKMTIVCFLSLGLIVTAIASYRLSFFVKVLNTANPVTNESPYNLRTPLSNIEANLAVIAACGPTLKWVFGLFIPFFDSNRSSRGASKGYTANNSSRLNRERSRRNFKSSNPDHDIGLTADEYVQYVGKDGGSAHSDIEMKDEPRWTGSKYRADADAQSDEQRITDSDERENSGIRKTVAWNVSSKEGREPPARPRDLV